MDQWATYKSVKLFKLLIKSRVELTLLKSLIRLYSYVHLRIIEINFFCTKTNIWKTGLSKKKHSQRTQWGQVGKTGWYRTFKRIPLKSPAGTLHKPIKQIVLPCSCKHTTVVLTNANIKKLYGLQWCQPCPVANKVRYVACESSIWGRTEHIQAKWSWARLGYNNLGFEMEQTAINL